MKMSVDVSEEEGCIFNDADLSFTHSKFLGGHSI